MNKAIRGKLIKNAYLAGIIDGEGSIFITRINNKKSGNVWYRLQVACGMTSPKAIELLRQFNPRLKQFVYIKGRKHGYKDVYQWLATGRTARNILQILKPYLLVKKLQAQLGIQFQRWRESLKNEGKPRKQKDLRRYEGYYMRMKALNDRSRND